MKKHQKVKLLKISKRVLSETIVSGPVKNSNPTNIKKNLKFDKKLDNFKLATIHKFLLGCDGENFHNAEADCIAMFFLCQLGHYFAEWADTNAISLNTFILK